MNTESTVRVRLNPFKHLAEGVNALFKTNTKTSALVLLVSSLGSVVMGAVEYALLRNFLGGGMTITRADVRTFLIKLFAFILVSALITAFFYSMFARVLITGTRNEKISFNNVLNVAVKRYGKVVLAFLVVLLCVAALEIVAVGLAFVFAIAHVPALSILLGLAALVVLIIFLLRMSYVLFVVVDDEEPPKTTSVLKRSAALWRFSGGALVLYWIMLIVALIVLSVLTGGFHHTSATPTYNFNSNGTLNTLPAANSVALGSLLISSFLSGLIGLVMYSGIGHIYNAAKSIADGHPN